METEILENAKMLLGISDGNSDALLSFLIKDTEEAVMAHCRITIVPYQLHGLIANIVSDIYRDRGYGNPSDNRSVRSVTEGERRVEFESGGIMPAFDCYLSRLQPFMNRAARLPSELEARHEEI